MTLPAQHRVVKEFPRRRVPLSSLYRLRSGIFAGAGGCEGVASHEPERAKLSASVLNHGIFGFPAQHRVVQRR